MLTVITSEQELHAALERLDVVFHSEPGTYEFIEAELLMSAIEKWEKPFLPPLPLPIEMIQYAMEQKGWSSADLLPILDPNEADEILTMKRHLSLPMIRWFHQNLGISLECLVQDYELAQPKI